MSVKRFVAKDMRRALELVRQEMGPDAIILSSRRIKQGVEILTSAQPQSLSASRETLLDQPQAGVDVPMDSDGAWRDQQLLDEAIHSHSALQHSRPQTEVAETSPGRFTLESVRAERAKPAVGERGPASGKTQDELAAELEQARLRMLAAREQEERSGASISELAERSDKARSSVERARYDGWSSQRHADHADMKAQLEQAARYRRSGNAAVTEDDTDGYYPPAARSPRRETADERGQQLQLETLQSELADMRLLLEEQLSRMANTPQQGTPVHTGLMRRLRYLGLTDGPAEAVVKQVRHRRTMQEAWADALAVLSQQLPSAAGDRVMEGGVFALVGPTGAGKTTTIAKLAARYVLEHGAENVTLVTTDTYRIAAHDQLRSLARILNVQVKVVDDNQDLPVVLRSLKHCPLVLIDTAGFRHGDSQLREQLQVLTALQEVQTLLVLSCNSQLQMMKATLHAHQSGRLQGVILTKLDEAASLGEAMSVLLEYKLPLFYTTNGQEIPQDIQVAKGHKLVAKAVSLLKSGMGSQGSTTTTAEQLY